MQKDLSYINYLIDKDIDKLKSMKPIYVDHLKNYNILMSAQMLLLGSSHQINYSRKIATDKELQKIDAELDNVASVLYNIYDPLDYFYIYNPENPKLDSKTICLNVVYQ